MEKIKYSTGKETKVYRNELKFYINYDDYLNLRNTFRTTMYQDENGDEDNEYWIRSLYFDTLLNDDYYDKMVGVMNRKKIRLRLYDTSQENIKIEIKNKFGQYMLKETATISRTDTEALILGNKETLLKYDSPITSKVYYFMAKDHYKPTVIIDYEREAYTYPIENIRITFDKNIRANGIDFDIFNKHLNTTRALDTEAMVLEVKYNKILPSWIRKTLANVSADKTAISKYCLGRRFF